MPLGLRPAPRRVCRSVSLERVEIIRGPSSSVYGTNAFFGVINLVTKKGRQLDGVALSGYGGSFSTGNGQVAYGQEFQNGLDLTLSASLFDTPGQGLFFPEFNEPDTNNGFAEATDYDGAKKFFSNLAFKDLSVQAVYGSREKGIPTAAFDTEFNDPRTQTGDTRSYLSVQHSRLLRNQTEITGRVAYDSYDYDGAYAVDYGDETDPFIVVNEDRSRADGGPGNSASPDPSASDTR